MSGGQPWSPYARSVGQTSRLLPPTLTSWRASVQHLITPFSGTVADSPRCIELSKTVPSVSRPSYLTVTVSVALGDAPVPGVIGIMIRPEAVLVAPGSRAAWSAKTWLDFFSSAAPPARAGFWTLL